MCICLPCMPKTEPLSRLTQNHAKVQKKTYPHRLSPKFFSFSYHKIAESGELGKGNIALKHPLTLRKLYRIWQISAFKLVRPRFLCDI